MSEQILKIWRSPYSRFGVWTEHPDDLQDETVLAEKCYSDRELKNIAGMGFNAIWVHGQLHHLVTDSRFPEFGKNKAVHMEAMKRLCARAAEYGISVYLYLQPPRAVAVSDTEFWNNHPDVGGQVTSGPGDDGKIFASRALCTSVPKVRDYIRDGFAQLCRALPMLGGFIIISASEYPSHCYSRRNCRPGEIRPRKQVLEHMPTDCPRCGQREPEDIVVELLTLIRDGVRSVSPDMKLLFWNWSWTMYLDAPCESIISRLPQDICLLADFERGGVREDGIPIDEYSLGYSGPSEQYLAVAEAAARRGIQVLPKLQLGTTHELATVRSLPILPSLFRKADYLRKHQVPGFMGCWNFGNLPSDSVKGFLFFLEQQEDLSEDEAMTALACRQYPQGNPRSIVRAWKLFAEAMEYYPFSVPFLYNSPVNSVLGLIPSPGPLNKLPFGPSHLPCQHGDSLEACLTPEFPLEKIIRNFQKMAEIWNQGVDLLKSQIGPECRAFCTAVICGAVWQSTVNFFQIYQLRKNWNRGCLPKFMDLCSRELEVAEHILPFVASDSEQGWHIEGNFYGFSRELLEEKIKVLRDFLKDA